MAARPPFMSMAPRPWTLSPSSVGVKGSVSQPLATLTVSMWPMSITVLPGFPLSKIVQMEGRTFSSLSSGK